MLGITAVGICSLYAFGLMVRDCHRLAKGRIWPDSRPEEDSPLLRHLAGLTYSAGVWLFGNYLVYKGLFADLARMIESYGWSTDLAGILLAFFLLFSTSVAALLRIEMLTKLEEATVEPA